MRKKTQPLKITPPPTEAGEKDVVEIKEEPTDAEAAPPSEDKPAFTRRSKNRRPVISDTVSAIPVAAFHRLVREITAELRSDLRWEKEALEALHVDSEAYLIENFDRGNKRRKLNHKSTLTREHFTGEPQAVACR
jgi:histone H3/H4